MVVLIVDDNEGDRALHGAALQANAYTVLLADGEQNVVELCRKTRPGMILLDGMLAHTDGFALCRALREQPEFRETPILILSGMEPDEAAVRAREAGANGFIPKAGDLQPLLAAIKSFHAAGK